MQCYKIVNDPINREFFSASPLFGDIAYFVSVKDAEFKVILPPEEDPTVSRVAVYHLKNKRVIGNFKRYETTRETP